MNSKARSVFLCPDCGGPSVVTEEGVVSCTQCEKQFQVPEQALPQIPSVPEVMNPSQATVQRNVSRKAKDEMFSAQASEKLLSEKAVVPREQMLAKGKVGPDSSRKGERRKRLKKRKTSLRVYVVWFLIWIGTVTTIFLVVTKFRGELVGSSQGDLLAERLAGEDRIFYEKEHPKIREQIRSFLAVRSVSLMSDFALETDQLNRKITRFYSENSFTRSHSKIKSSPLFWNVAFEENPGFVEVVWEAPNAQFVEGVFVKVNEKWVLDWEHFARYSSESWSLFRQQIGRHRDGVFRVYVREVVAGENENFEPWIKIQILPTYRDTDRREREASEIIHLDAKNPITKKVIALFAERAGQSEGFSELWKRNPKGLNRALLRLEWAKDDATGEERIIIKDVLANHWRGLDSLENQPRSDDKGEKVTKK